MRALTENRAALAACCLALFVARMALLPADTAALTWNRAFALLTRAIARRAARKRNAIGDSFVNGMCGWWAREMRRMLLPHDT